MKLDNCSAVITGASAGIGREFARQLALRAQCIVLVARRRDRLEELRLELQARNPALQVEIQVADLSVLEQVMELGRALSKDKPVDFLINNAGLCCLRRDKSVRDKLQRSASCGSSGERDFGLRTLSRTSAHRIHDRRSPRTTPIGNRSRICTRAGRQGGTRRTKRNRMGQTA